MTRRDASGVRTGWEVEDPNTFLPFFGRDSSDRGTSGVAAVCRHCGERKPAAAFPTQRRNRSGLSSWCKACHARANREWRARRRAVTP